MILDLNCDMGEGIGNDAAIMPYITSANIACGYHAGDENTIYHTIALAKEHGVAVGAHPSFLDRKNFGRTEMSSTPEEVNEIIVQQVKIVQQIAAACGVPLHHVKPHGALYNMAARDPLLAKAIAQAVKSCAAGLLLYGLSGSHLITEAKAIGLHTRSEVFADRTYKDDGSLTPRSQPHALIEDEAEAIAQVKQMVMEGTVTSVSGKKVPIVAETVCLHGDGKNAVLFAKQLWSALHTWQDVQPL